MGKNLILEIKKILTEFTEKFTIFLVTGCTIEAAIMQAPQPPSLHMYFVPVRYKLFLRYSFSFMSGGRASTFTVCSSS